MEELIKPVKVVVEHWDYHEVINYIERKYGFDSRDYGGKYKYYNECKEKADQVPNSDGWYTTKPLDFNEDQKKAYELFSTLLKSSPEYLDFWHLYCDSISGNGSYLYLGFEPLDEEYDPNDPHSFPEWAKEILKLIKEEFSPDGQDMKCWVEW